MAMKEWTSKRLPTKPNMGTNMHKEMETDKHLNAADSLRNFANAREPIVFISFMARGIFPFAKWVERRSSTNICSPRSTMCGAMRISECLAQYEKFQAFLSHGCRMPIWRFFLRVLSPELTQYRCIWRIHIWEIYWQFHGTCWMPGSGEHCHLLHDCEGFYHVSAARTGGPTEELWSWRNTLEFSWILYDIPQKTRMVTWNLKISLSKRNIIIQTLIFGYFWVPYQFSGVYIICYILVHVRITFWAGCCHLQGDEGPFWAWDDKNNCKSCLIK